MMMGTALRAFAHPTDFLQRLGLFCYLWHSGQDFCDTLRMGRGAFGKTAGQTIQQAKALIHLAPPQPATVRRDPPAAKTAGHLAPAQGLKCQLFRLTLCFFSWL